MISMGEDGTPMAVPPLELDNSERKRRYYQARQRRDLRHELKQRYQDIHKSEVNAALLGL